MAKSKATHKGECQICGKSYKLPQGRLAQHGHTVRWAMFHDVCPGSLALPYEQSTALLRSTLPLIERKLKVIEEHSSSGVLAPKGDVEGLTIYVNMCQDRIANWKAKDLTPLV